MRERGDLFPGITPLWRGINGSEAFCSITAKGGSDDRVTRAMSGLPVSECAEEEKP